MASGITLTMRYIRRPAPTYLVEHRTKAVKRGNASVRVRDGVWETYVNHGKNRSLAGKARRRARRRTPFFKGHGVAGANDYNLRYTCPCGHGIVAPLNDFDFITDVMEHEDEHREDVAS